MIPSKADRRAPIGHDPFIYKERHLVECFINKIKHFRRIATRYEKTAAPSQPGKHMTGVA